MEIDVKVNISGIILNVDESILNVELGRRYEIKKIYLENWKHKDKIIDGRKQLKFEYDSSNYLDGDKVYFFGIEKNEIYTAELNNSTVISDLAKSYKNDEIKYLYRKFALLKIYKESNICYKDIFIEQQFNMGLLKDNRNFEIENTMLNTIDDRKFKLSDDEIQNCNDFLNDYSGVEYDFMEDVIDQFLEGSKQTYSATAFKEYTTALEMVLLSKNQANKKEVLSKRIAVLLGEDHIAVAELYEKIKLFYRLRSNSTHEGKNDSITKSELLEWENIVKRVIKIYLNLIKIELLENPDVSWDLIKNKQIVLLKEKVVNLIALGVLSE